MNPLEQIDFVFSFIKTYLTHSASISTNYIWLHVEKTSESDINRMMFDDIMKQLETDGLIEKQPLEEGNPQAMYHITFKARLFKGYAEENRLQELEQTRVRNLEQQAARNATAMTWLTIFIAIGTIIAAVYYLKEICK